MLTLGVITGFKLRLMRLKWVKKRTITEYYCYCMQFDTPKQNKTATSNVTVHVFITMATLHKKVNIVREHAHRNEPYSPLCNLRVQMTGKSLIILFINLFF